MFVIQTIALLIPCSVVCVVAYRHDRLEMSKCFLLVTALLLVAMFGMIIVATCNNSTTSVINQITENSAKRKEIITIYESAKESRDKHRQTSARAFVDQWNADVRWNKEMKDNAWIGIFVSDDVADAMEFIEVEECS